jgi:hypothetical protein
MSHINGDLGYELVVLATPRVKQDGEEPPVTQAANAVVSSRDDAACGKGMTEPNS